MDEQDSVLYITRRFLLCVRLSSPNALVHYCGTSACPWHVLHLKVLISSYISRTYTCGIRQGSGHVVHQQIYMCVVHKQVLVSQYTSNSPPLRTLDISQVYSWVHQQVLATYYVSRSLCLGTLANSHLCYTSRSLSRLAGPRSAVHQQFLTSWNISRVQSFGPQSGPPFMIHYKVLISEYISSSSRKTIRCWSCGTLAAPHFELLYELMLVLVILCPGNHKEMVIVQ